MNIITFYSFKGGVGRTMAMVNVAFAMARAGKRVLLVDFDLEAPGLETFKDIRPATPRKGIVEFVSEYIQTGTAPNAAEFIYEVEADSGRTGKVFVMPAGLRDSSYGLRLNSIDWQSLYRDQDGFVLFEDLKEQWARTFLPDYVLIDSRTGHTDVGGICTRQLPNQVVLCYLPNEQNYQGIVKVAHDIRTENEKRVTSEAIKLHFVASNVPELDDEERILEKRFEQFGRAGCGPDVTIHHYPSMALLEQEIFVLRRPKSRLSNEYNKLRRQVIRQNLEDREGVVAYLSEQNRIEEQVPIERLRQIRKKFEADPEVLFFLAGAYENQNRFTEKLDLLMSAAQLAKVGRALEYVTRGEILREIAFHRSAARLEADEDVIWQLLEEPDAAVADLKMAGKSLRIRNKSDASRYMSTLAFRNQSLSGKIDLLEDLFEDGQFVLAKEILSSISEALEKAEHVGTTNADLAIVLVASGKADLALKILSSPPWNRQSVLADAFNYAMASWKKSKSPSKELFQHVIQLCLERADKTDGQPNFAQAMAISYAVVGENTRARQHLKNARKAVGAIGSDETVLSAWRYMYVYREVFEKDLDEIEAFIDGGRILPRVVKVKSVFGRGINASVI